ncbi:MAG: VWA domain-containing protein [Planctomycetes bacterium]|nr:VWA domain-containing protein [Planctomycetota bacterium]
MNSKSLVSIIVDRYHSMQRLPASGVLVTVLALSFGAIMPTSASTLRAAEHRVVKCSACACHCHQRVCNCCRCRRPVDLVICLDTSGSMTQLIDSARSRLWDVVNELATVKPTPTLRVGLLTYGTPNNSTARSGWVVRQLDLTNDLDEVYAKMMAMKTSGGDEFVGWVLNDAVEKMSWSSDPRALRVIFVAGNESADQARSSYDFRYVAENAQAKQIVINSIYAGNHQQGRNEMWHEVARHGRGSYSAIDMAQGTIQIETPYDKLLSELNTKLNDTYLAFGQKGKRSKQRQEEQDANAAKVGAQAQASRAAAKSTPLYANAMWDLVDASKEEGFELESLKNRDLPERMQAMAPAEQKAYLEGMVARRNEVQVRMQKINADRNHFLKRKKQALQKDGKQGLGDAMLAALRQQAEDMGFVFGDESQDVDSPKQEKKQTNEKASE